MRRLRGHPGLRKLVSEANLTVDDLIQPLFIKHGVDVREPIASMPGQWRYSVDQLGDILTQLQAVRLPAVLLFGIPAFKDATGSAARQDDGVVQQAARFIKQQAPELLVIADLCYCEYTDHGHCGIWHQGDVDNDATLPLLGEQAVSLAKAGVDVIAPSGMMDGGVGAVREALDQAGFQQLPILGYAVKYCSALYGPFREAAEGKMQFGDRATYQMNPANTDEALREAQLDVDEGVDMLMVKPAHAYLDVIYRVKEAFPGLPLVGYHTSAEYAMLQAAADRGWIDRRAAMLEVLMGIKRAGADCIISYAGLEVARWLSEG